LMEGLNCHMVKYQILHCHVKIRNSGPHPSQGQQQSY